MLIKKITFFGPGFNENTIALNERSRCVQRFIINTIFSFSILIIWGINDGFSLFSKLFASLSWITIYTLVNLFYYNNIKKGFNGVNLFYLFSFILLDISSIIVTLLITPEKLAFLSPVFLFTCIGLGLRYGKKMMHINIILALFLFTIGIIYNGKYWQNNMNMTGMIYVMMIGVPLGMFHNDDSLEGKRPSLPK